VSDPSQTEVIGISGTASALYAVTDLRRLLLATDGVTFTTAIASLPNAPSSLLVTDGGVFVLSNNTLDRCVPPCNVPGDFVSFSIPSSPAGHRFIGLCGTSANDLLLVGNELGSAPGGLWTRFTGGALPAPQTIGIDLATGCSAESSQTRWVTGTTRVAATSGSGFTSQGVNLAAFSIDPATQRWLASTTVAGTTFVVGTDERIMQRTGTTWTLPVNVGSGHWLKGVAGTGPTRVVAVGDRGCSSCADPILVWDFDGVTWRRGPTLRGLTAVRAVVAVADTIYVAGRGVNRPGIVRLVPR